ncbi:MAG: ABC transporter substrate-binding protein [Treponemataceae bacterium]|nr:ABC transporter substrate-binding protein [Treponemataceae bacterium]
MKVLFSILFYRRQKKGGFLRSTIIFVILLTGSCELSEPRIVHIWTDRPELAVYGELFNSQERAYKVEVSYYENLSEQLLGTRFYPDIVIGSWLKSSSTRTYFKDLNYFFDELLLNRTAFYTPLLELGNIDGKQYLLPVSFNLPLVLFPRDQSSLINKPGILNLEDIRDRSKLFNQIGERGEYLRMGFSPRWSDDFLYIITRLFGAAFREGNPIAWNGGSLEKAMNYVYQWSIEVNGGPQQEDDFAFKYLVTLPPAPLNSGKVLFAYQESQKLFISPEEQRQNLDFRWVSKDNRIPILEGETFLGIYKKNRAKRASDAFVQWLYREETQRKILEFSKKIRLNEQVFGIAQGFSAIRSVNEEIFPQFYPLLLGHMPPAEYLLAPEILPADWPLIREQVILPYLHDRSKVSDKSQVQSLEGRLDVWKKQQKGTRK